MSMDSRNSSQLALPDGIAQFLSQSNWSAATLEALTGDASTRRYFRLKKDHRSAVLMDASRALESMAPFIQIDRHLHQLGFSVPSIFASDEQTGLMLLEDFGDATFTGLLDRKEDQKELYTLAVEVLIALHKHQGAIPRGLREYRPRKMLEDIGLFLTWRTPGISDQGKEEFQQAWAEVLPLAHQVPTSLLLRDYHVANLMLLAGRPGIRRAGLLDFQDAYQGPISYDLMSLLEDARRDVPPELKGDMIAHYLGAFPALDRPAFETSLAILAAQRHTRVLAIFERLSKHEGKHAYRKLHSPRVEGLLRSALTHPALSRIKRWFELYAQ
jgi:N-acetylmuramate 1-kinase